jgi:hypothetical protein
MLHIKNKIASIHKLAVTGLLLSGLLLVASLPGFARDKDETIDATAFGTGTQLGANIGVTLNIYQFSTPADKAVLVQAYEIKMIPTPTGRKIVFVTNRQIRFAEAWTDSQTMSYDLTAGIIEINDQDKSKSTGVLYPAAQLVLDKQGQLQWDLNQNPWKLVDILDWKGTPGVN